MEAYSDGHQSTSPLETANPQAIVLAGLAVKYGEFEALASIDLSVGPREFVSLLGPSGCGKTTLMKAIAGLIEPSGGEMTVLGGSVLEARQRKALGLVFQQPNLLPWRRAWENATLLSEIIGSTAQDAERTRELMTVSGLSQFSKLHPYQMSGGMQQRLALVRTLAFDPQLLLMDEPFASLDALSRDRLGDVLLRIWDESKPVVFVTHSIEEAAYLSDRVVVMSARPGRVLAEVRIDLPRPRQHEMKETQAFFETTRELRRWINVAQAGASEGE